MKKAKTKPQASVSFEELWEIMEDAVENIEYDEVPRDWRTMPELDFDPDDEEIEPDNKEISDLKNKSKLTNLEAARLRTYP